MNVLPITFRAARTRLETLENDARVSLGTMLEMMGVAVDEATAEDWRAAAAMLEATIKYQNADLSDEQIVAAGELLERALTLARDIAAAFWVQGEAASHARRKSVETK
jgi:hypothetical protein